MLKAAQSYLAKVHRYAFSPVPQDGGPGPNIPSLASRVLAQAQRILAITFTVITFLLKKLKFAKNLAIGIFVLLQIVLLYSFFHTNPKFLIVDGSESIYAYRSLINEYGPKLHGLTLEHKCDLYFEELYNLNSSWVVETLRGIDYSEAVYDPGYKDRIVEDILRKQAEEKLGDRVLEEGEQLELGEATKGQTSEAKLTVLEKTELVKYVEKRIAEAITHLRIFSKCYLREKTYLDSLKEKIYDATSVEEEEEEPLESSDPTAENEKDNAKKSRAVKFHTKQMCKDTEARLFPWISRKIPVYERWNGDIYKDNIPNIAKISRSFLSRDETSSTINPDNTSAKDDAQKESAADSAQISKAPTKDECFMEYLRKSFNGKGITLTVADRFADNLVRLVLLLRALNNRLPIEFVHKNDLNSENRQRIIKAARAKKIELEPELEALKKHLSSSNRISSSWPKQEVWFVNVEECISPDYRDYFSGFANKLLPTIFSSFDEMLLMDTDVVTFVPPIHYFQMESYKKTGTLFFQDRWNWIRNSHLDTRFFKKLLPNKMDHVLFDIPLPTEFTTGNRYLGSGYLHLQEAGVVLLRRSDHFSGLLIATQLIFWAPASAKVWGDKELFWLGQSISGNENYAFNKFPAAAAGQVTEGRPSNHSIELCTTHPAHISEDDEKSLLWINSGFKFCDAQKGGDEGYKEDLQRDRYKDKYTEDELKKLYRSPMYIDTALIPPDGGFSVEDPLPGEPSMSWTMSDYCSRYLWCAYDVVGYGKPEIEKGIVIHYEKETTNIITYYGSIWDAELKY